MDTNPNTGNTKRRGRKVTEEKPQKITIEVSRYKSLMDALDNDSKMWRIVLTIFLCGVLLFSGITVVVISIKSFYPYSDISTNALGVTTLKNEKKEISYWLFNTAELWAKSGIRVKKGQTITVRASGKKHTAVHHLYKDADSNASRMNEPWVGTKGFATNEYSRQARDIYRSKYRVFPEENQDALLMQIVRNGKEPDTRPSAAHDKKYKFSCADSENRFLLIGDKQENIYIEEDGELYFAINDIVTDDLTICRMILEIVKANRGTTATPEQQKAQTGSSGSHIEDKYNNPITSLEDCCNELHKIRELYDGYINGAKRILNCAGEDAYKKFKGMIDSCASATINGISKDQIDSCANEAVNSISGQTNNPSSRTKISQKLKDEIESSARATAYKKFKEKFGLKEDEKNNIPNVFGFGKNDKGEFELFGYFIDKYETPWYDDNIGSFLIVVEISSE